MYTELTEDTLKDGKKIVVFTTDWCGDCIALKQYIGQVIEENPEWEFIMLNSDDNMDFARENNVFGIPSFLAFEDGKKVAELISKDPKPKSLINSWIKTIGLI